VTVRGSVRRLLSLLVAIVTGLGAAILDTGRGFDDMGVLVTGLVFGGALSAVVAGRVRPGWLVLLALLAGLPVPLAEFTAGGSPVAFAATVLAAIGVGIGAIATRLMAPQTT
jgi:hypothetical protein